MSGDEKHGGRWLIEHFAGLGEIELPPRGGSRPDPFEGWIDEDFAEPEVIAERFARLFGHAKRTDESAPAPSEPVAKRLIVNGEPRDVAAATLAEVLVALDYAGAIVATALNGEFVPARKRETTALKDGDRIEIVAPRQGG